MDSIIRYGQCWEDADILLEALRVRPGDVCLSIASAGDNTLAMLSKAPAKVIAVDMNPAQLACLALRVAAYQCLPYAEMLELVGARASLRRSDLYGKCRSVLDRDSRQFWDCHGQQIACGIGTAGKFESYLTLFRRRILPCIDPWHRRDRWRVSMSEADREHFYHQVWDSRRWRILFRLFFSRTVMGQLGRDPACFNFVDGSVADRILERTKYALTTLDPSQNPYLQWILYGQDATALPYALRPQNFDAIRANLHVLEWHCQSLGDYLADRKPAGIQCFNLSDIFEYMSLPEYHHLLAQLVDHARPGARLAYWNLLAPRRRPDFMAASLRPLSALARSLHERDKGFFYGGMVVEEVIG